LTVASGQFPRALQSIQVCRGIAALLVVLFHLSGAVAAQKYFGEPRFGYIFHSAGAVGVCFFFVLSGFIITSVHWNDVGKPARFPAYLYKRFVRIYPIYWLVFWAAFLATFAVPGASDGVPKDIITLSKSALLLPQDPSVLGGTGAPVLCVAWSLQYEVLFYAFFGLLILNRIAALAFAAAVISSSLAGNTLGWSLPLHFLNPIFFALFGSGLLAGLAVRAKLWSSYARPAAFLGAAGLIAAMAITAQPELNAICGLGAGLLIFGLATIEKVRRFKIWKGWLLLGDSSYVLYLVHYPIISMACKIGIAAGLVGFAGAAITWVVTVPLCVVIAALIHVMIEMPMMTTARAFIGRAADARKPALAKASANVYAEAAAQDQI
jgi:exopolysaccharide production protein ExoZ